VKDIIIKGYKFVETCSMCPEQYEVFKDDKQVAYIRVRWSYANCEVPDCGGTVIHEINVDEGTMTGGFIDENQRDEFFNKVIEVLEK